MLSAFPWMRNIPGVGHYLCDLAYKATMDVTDMMEEYILKHRDTLDVNEPRDFIDMMLIHGVSEDLKLPPTKRHLGFN